MCVSSVVMPILIVTYKRCQHRYYTGWMSHMGMEYAYPFKTVAMGVFPIQFTVITTLYYVGVLAALPLLFFVSFTHNVSFVLSYPV